MVYADPAIFSVFTLPMISGSPLSALMAPHSIVINERTAMKYFNSTNVVGKVLTFDDTAQYKITGVIKNIPKQSHFNFDFFISMTTLDESRESSWLSNNFNTYILLKPGSDYKKLEGKLPVFLYKHAGPEMESVIHLTFKSFERAGNYFRFSLTPLTKIHLESNRVAEMGANGSMQYVIIFSAIAVFILLIACVNFMNLSTARSSNRAREVGVRKVLGSPRKYLVAQFLTESIMVTLAGALIALFASWALLPLFNQSSGKELIVTPQILSWLLPVLVAIIFVIGCLAGSYPAFFLSGFNPIDVLKGKLSSGFKGGLLRSFLVVFQFAISIFLIIGTLVIYNQLNFIQTKDLGYNRNHVMIIQNTGSLGSRAKTFKEEVQQLAGVESVSLSEALPTWDYGNSTVFFKSQVIDQKTALTSQYWGVDEKYIPTLGMKIVAGRNFATEMATDSAAVLINQAAVKQLGYADPLNETIYKLTDNEGKHLKALHVIGVIKDFNFRSLRENVTPMIFLYSSKANACSMRITSNNIPELLAQVKQVWTSLSPNQQFGYSFMDKDFDAMYRTEQRTGTIALSFTSLALVIACLGLFGLAAYAAEQRVKEIGIRKVLGAKISAIVAMLSKDFILLVFISILIASPLSWWAMNAWLRGFAYRQNIQLWVFASAGITAIVIAFFTISFQAIKAAISNPVKNLRSE